jgi:two-component system NtrC family sensor kinase
MPLEEHELKRVLDSLFDQVLVINQHFLIEHANRSSAEALGYDDPSEIVGKHCYEISHGQDHPCNDADHPCPLALVLKHGRPVTVEHLHLDKEGNPVQVEIRAVPLGGENGRVTRVAEIFRDITAERLLQEQLHQTTQKSEQIFQKAGSGILVLDKEYRIKEANRIASDLLGLPAEDLHDHDLRRFMAKQDVSFLEGMCREVENDESKRLSSEVQLVAATGEKRDTEVHISGTTGLGDRRIYAYLRDITHRKRVESKLFEATRKFQKIAEMGEDAILVLDDRYNVEFANSMALDLTGHSDKELMGLDFLTLLDKDDRKFLLDLYEDGKDAEGRRVCTQMELRTASQQKRRCEVCISATSFAEGAKKTYVYIRDLSERLRMENKLREANEFLSNLIETSTDGIIAADMKGRVIIFNKGAEHLLGYKAEEVLGKFNVANFYPPGVARAIMRRLRSKEYGGKGRALPHRIIGVSKTGEHIPITLSSALIYEGGQETASVGIFYDLREILRAQEELLESEAKFRELFETVRHGLYFSSREGKFLECNQAMVEMLGYQDKGEVLAIDLARDLYLDASDRLEFQRMIEAEEYVKDYEVQFKKKDGEPLTVMLTAHVSKDRAGTVLGYQGLFVNITERKRLEQQLFQSEKLAAMGRLTAQIAHELNNPIYGVMNCLDLLKSEVPESSSKRRFLDMATSETKRISELLRGMLSFFRPDEDVKSLVNLNGVIDDVILFVGKQLHEFKIHVVLDLAEEMPKVFASGNQMKQVLLNLIMNAKTAMPRGGTLRIATRAIDGKVQFNVSDTGTGIPEDIRDRIFEAFFTTKSDVKGVGLGLSVCFGIIRQHNGEIEVESEIDVGTTFVVTLPLQS